MPVKLDSLSASRIKTYLMCPFKYYMTYELGIDMGTNWGARHGTLIHNVLERYALGERSNWREVLLEEYLRIDDKLHTTVFAHAKTTEYTERTKKCDKCPLWLPQDNFCTLEDMHVDDTAGCGSLLYNRSVKLLEHYFEEYGHIYNRDIIGVEKKFNLEPAAGIKARGFIDYLYRDDSGIVHMVDYKTSKKYEPSQNHNAIKDDIQARIYGWAMRQLFPDDEIHMLTFHFFNNRPITVWYNEAEIEKTRQYLVDIWQEIKSFHENRMYRIIDNSRFPPNACKYLCDMKQCHKQWRAFCQNNRGIG